MHFLPFSITIFSVLRFDGESVQISDDDNISASEQRKHLYERCGD